MGFTTLQGEFEAWIDKQPGADNRLIVIGKVKVSSGGWSASLVEATPIGINPRILILDLTVAPPSPSTTVTEGSPVVNVHFERPGSQSYEQVTIRDTGHEFTIPVGVTNSGGTGRPRSEHLISPGRIPETEHGRRAAPMPDVRVQQRP